MENLPEKSKAPTTSLAVSRRIKEVAAVIVGVNDLVGYKLEGNEILRWSGYLDESFPQVEAEKLAFLMKMFREEQIMWDRNKGIQNIFLGLKRIRKTEEGYKLLREIY